MMWDVIRRSGRLECWKEGRRSIPWNLACYVVVDCWVEAFWECYNRPEYRSTVVLVHACMYNCTVYILYIDHMTIFRLIGSSHLGSAGNMMGEEVKIFHLTLEMVEKK